MANDDVYESAPPPRHIYISFPLPVFGPRRLIKSSSGQMARLGPLFWPPTIYLKHV